MGIWKLLNHKNDMKKSTDAQPTTWGDMYRFFENHGAITESLVNALLWQPETTYKVGAGVSSPSLPPGTIARCTVAGTTGGEEPQWTAVGTTLTDGTVTWLIETQVNAAIMEQVNAAIMKQVNNLNKTISDLHTTVTRETEARFLKAFPVGTIIETEVDVNPGTYIGGTWEKMPAGYVTISAGTYTETQDGKAVTYDFKAGNTYGEAAHKLTVGELPSHIHANPVGGYSGWGNINGTVDAQYAIDISKASMNGNGQKFTGPGVWSPTNEAGGNKYHNVMQPSFTVYRFKRVS